MNKFLNRISNQIIYFFLLFITGVTFSLSANQSFHSTELNVELEHFIQEMQLLESQSELDGTLLIAKGDQILFSIQSQELGNPAQAEPQFMIGSLTKQFFAAALLKLLYDKYPHEAEFIRIKHVKQQLARPLSHFYLLAQLFGKGRCLDGERHYSSAVVNAYLWTT